MKDTAIAHLDQPFVDPWEYHTPLFRTFEARHRVQELPESDYEPDYWDAIGRSHERL